MILLAASLIFYAWGEPVYVIIMLFSICMNYWVGRWIAFASEYGKVILGLGVFLNLSLLFYFKYINFFLVNVRAIFPWDFPIPSGSLPLGISFFTFQAMTYLIDLERKKFSPQNNIFHLALYISLFPQLIAGPIVRYHHIEKQITNRSVTLEKFTEGVRRFIVGFSKKILIANTFGKVADEIFAMPAQELTTVLVIFAVIAYTFQIYFDFSAYSDMAIGLGRMFGFHFYENFNYPYISKSIREFWRRWHISFSSFLRDYLYIPLGGSKGGKAKTYRNLIIVFFLCGLWHGAGWTFIIWGLYFGFFLILERMFLGRLLAKSPSFLSWLYTITVVMISWLIFRAENLGQVFNMLDALFAGRYSPVYEKYSRDIFLQICLIFGIIGSTPFFKDKILESSNRYMQVGRDLFLSLVFIVSLSFLAAGTYNPFIYFRF